MADNKKTGAKKYYVIDQNKHTITVDTTIKPAKGDEEAVKLYVNMGYDLRIKSQARATAMKAKADGLDAAAIREALKGDKAGLAKFEAIMNGTDTEYKKGFFAAKKWFKEYKGV